MRYIFASILINNYNNERFIKESIESALFQTYGDVEVIVCDNGSNDSSLEILRRYSSKIKIVENLNRKSINSLNQYLTIVEAFKICTGDIIFLLDGDDVFLKNKVERVMPFFDNPDLVYLQHIAYKMDENSKSTNEIAPLLINKKDYLAYIEETGSIISLFAPTSCQVYRRSFLEKVIYKINELELDLVWTDLRLPYNALFNGKTYFLEEPLLKYRVHTNNDSSRLKKASTYLQFLNQCSEYFQQTAAKYNYKMKLLSPVTKMLMYSPIINRYMNLNFLENLTNENPIFVWGAGEAGQGLFYWLESKKLPIEGFIEGNKFKQGEIVLGKKVFSEEILNQYDKVVAIISPFYAASVIERDIKKKYADRVKIINPYNMG